MCPMVQIIVYLSVRKNIGIHSRSGPKAVAGVTIPWHPQREIDNFCGDFSVLTFIMLVQIGQYIILL